VGREAVGERAAIAIDNKKDKAGGARARTRTRALDGFGMVVGGQGGGL
jgi:hypothetical protein